MRPLSVPAVSSMIALTSVGLPLDTASSMAALRRARSTGSPACSASNSGVSAAGRGRLPTWVVRTALVAGAVVSAVALVQDSAEIL